MNPYAFWGAGIGAVLGKFIIYWILVWIGGRHDAHPFRQIVGFNLCILAGTAVTDASTATPWSLFQWHTASTLIVIGVLLAAEAKRNRIPS